MYCIHNTGYFGGVAYSGSGPLSSTLLSTAATPQFPLQKSGQSAGRAWRTSSSARHRLDASIAPPSSPTHPHARQTPGKQFSRTILFGTGRLNPPRKKSQKKIRTGHSQTPKQSSLDPLSLSLSLCPSLGAVLLQPVTDLPTPPLAEPPIPVVFSHRFASDAHPQHQQNMTVSASTPPVRPAFDT